MNHVPKHDSEEDTGVDVVMVQAGGHDFRREANIDELNTVPANSLSKLQMAS